MSNRDLSIGKIAVACFSYSAVARSIEIGRMEDATNPDAGKLLHEEITRSIIAAFFAVYDKLGFGFLEKVYCAALEIELRRRGHKVARDVAVNVYYDGRQIARQKMDFVVDELIILEIKARFVLGPTDRPQLLNYLRATTFDVGLLLHFGPKPRFYRMVAADHLHRR